jgi:hypothetical protein
MKAGIYPGLTMAEYLAMPALSASLLQTMLEECPAAAWFDSWMNPKPRADNGDAAMNAGTIAHAILLEGSTANVAVIDPRDHPNEKGGGHPIGWTNKSIKAAKTAAIEAGKVPVLLDDMASINAMVDQARAFIESLRHAPADDLARSVWAAFQPAWATTSVRPSIAAARSRPSAWSPNTSSSYRSRRRPILCSLVGIDPGRLRARRSKVRAWPRDVGATACATTLASRIRTACATPSCRRGKRERWEEARFTAAPSTTQRKLFGKREIANPNPARGLDGLLLPSRGAGEREPAHRARRRHREGKTFTGHAARLRHDAGGRSASR